MSAVIKSVLLLSILFVLVGALGAAGTGRPAVRPEKADDKTLSPYFFVKSDDPAVDQLPLKSTSADVNISGVIADVKVTQVYKNEGKRPIEAIYVFPASTRAAVYGVKMTIGERIVVAKIRKRDDARREYEQARKEGKSASLLEQQRPNVFQMNVANIMPGDIIKVELSYTELLVPEDGVYEFVYPTVAGPRYSNQPAETAAPEDKWVANPYTHQGEAPTYAFDISVKVAAGLPVRDIYCPSHKVIVAYDGPASASIRLDSSESKGGNRDYILKYRLEGEKIEAGLLLCKGESENFFLLMMQPPKRVTLAQIPGREYIFIVDVSGSMYGYPLEISKKLLRDLIGKLRPTDIFNVLLFSGGSSVMSGQSLPATSENISKALSMIDSQKGGGTELLPALKKALSLPRTEEYSRSVIIATDGYVTVETEAFDLIRKNLGNANMFTFGIGTSVNRYLLEGMARAGMGEPFVIASEAEAAAKAEKFRKIVQSPVLTGIKLDFGNFDVYDVEPLSVPDVMADRPVIVFGKWRGNPRGTIKLTGTSGSGLYTRSINAGEINPAATNSALKYLWARNRISVLADYNFLQSDSKRIEEATKLGLKYNLLTAYTSFIAVDSEVRNKDGQSTTVNQPLPLPEGVSDYAVGKFKAAPSSPRIMYKEMRHVEDTTRRSGLARQESAQGAAAEMKGQSLVSLEKIEAANPSDAEAIKKTVESRISGLQRCNSAGLHGRITLNLVIGVDGSVKSAIITSEEIKDKKFRKCIADAIRKWRFDAPASSADMTVKITLVF
jgi:Ca-activated chloride channel homolog